MCFHFQNIKFGVQVSLVEIGLTVWQKNGGRAKVWSKIHIYFDFYFNPPLQERNAANNIFEMCVYFQKFKFGVQAPLVEIGLTVWAVDGSTIQF